MCWGFDTFRGLKIVVVHYIFGHDKNTGSVILGHMREKHLRTVRGKAGGEFTLLPSPPCTEWDPRAFEPSSGSRMDLGRADSR